MKQSELQPCIICDKGLAHDGDVTFLRVRVEHLAIDFRAVREQAGLEMMLGAAAPLAAVLGPDRDIAVPLGAAVEVLVCQGCALKGPAPFHLLEAGRERAERQKESAR